MQVVHERCCGLDVHKKNVVACVLTNDGKRVRTFGTVTKELLRLLDWLQGERITHLAMESRGVWGAESPSELSGDPYDQPPSMLLFVLYACLRLLVDLAVASDLIPPRTMG